MGDVPISSIYSMVFVEACRQCKYKCEKPEKIKLGIFFREPTGRNISEVWKYDPTVSAEDAGTLPFTYKNSNSWFIASIHQLGNAIEKLTFGIPKEE